MTARRPLLTAAVAAICLVFPEAQSLTHSERRVPSQQEFLLPWSGPGAAVFNPAHLADGKRFFLETSQYGSPSGRAVWPFLQGSVGLPGGLAAGIWASWEGGGIFGSNAVHEESRFGPMFAIGLPASIAGARLALGASLPIRVFNAFLAVKTTAVGLDLGALMAWNSTPAGGLEAGLALHDLIPAYVDLPDDRGRYRAYEWSADLSLLYSLPQQWMDLYLVFTAHPEKDQSEGGGGRGGIGWDALLMDVKTFGFEYRPVPWLGLKYEEPWDDAQIAWGMLLRPPVLLGASPEVEVDFYHPEYLDPRPDFMIQRPGTNGSGMIASIVFRCGF